MLLLLHFTFWDSAGPTPPVSSMLYPECRHSHAKACTAAAGALVAGDTRLEVVPLLDGGPHVLVLGHQLRERDFQRRACIQDLLVYFILSNSPLYSTPHMCVLAVPAVSTMLDDNMATSGPASSSAILGHTCSCEGDVTGHQTAHLPDAWNGPNSQCGAVLCIQAEQGSVLTHPAECVACVSEKTSSHQHINNFTHRLLDVAACRMEHCAGFPPLLML